MKDSILGTSYLAIRAAIPELERRKLSVLDYRITVIDDGGTVGVVFHDPGARPLTMGNTGKAPGLTVELEKDSLRVIRANYIR